MSKAVRYAGAVVIGLPDVPARNWFTIFEIEPGRWAMQAGQAPELIVADGKRETLEAVAVKALELLPEVRAILRHKGLL